MKNIKIVNWQSNSSQTFWSEDPFTLFSITEDPKDIKTLYKLYQLTTALLEIKTEQFLKHSLKNKSITC